MTVSSDWPLAPTMAEAISRHDSIIVFLLANQRCCGRYVGRISRSRTSRPRPSTTPCQPRAHTTVTYSGKTVASGAAMKSPCSFAGSASRNQ
jgi:hypothetical protein